MAIHLVIIGLLFALIIASFILSVFSGNKVFLFVAFLLLMFGGVIIQSSGGVIIDSQPLPSGSTWEYVDVIVTLEDSALFLFSQGCFYIGLVLSSWVGLVGAFGSSKPRKSPFSYS